MGSVEMDRINRENTTDQQILDSLNFPFMVINVEDYTIERWNSAAEMIYGENRGGKRCYNYVFGKPDPCSVDDTFCPMAAVKKTKNPVIIEQTPINVDGVQKTYEIHAYPIFDPEGKLIKIAEFSLDISQRKRAENALKRSEEYVRSILASIDDLVFILNESGEFIDFPQAHHDPRLLTPPNEFIGKHYSEFLSPDVTRLMDRAIHDVRMTKSVQNFDYSLLIRDQEFIGDASVTLRKNHLGEYDGVTIVIRDITVRKKLEVALEESEKNLQSLLESLPVGVFRSDLKTSQLLYVNGKLAFDILGYTREEMMAEPALFRWVYPKKRAELIQELQKKGVVTDYELETWTNTGEIRTLSTNITIHPDKGYMAGTAVDVTDQRKTEQALEHSEQKFRKLFHSAKDAAFITKFSPEGNPLKFIEVNEEACMRYGYSREELLEMTIFDISDPSMASSIPNNIQTLLDTGRTTFETTHIAKNGKKIPVEISSVLFKLGQDTVVQSYARDVSKRKIAELELKGRTHDLGERVKELTCLYDLSKILSDPNQPIEDVFKRVVKIIPPAWQYPEITCVRLSFGDQHYNSEGFNESPWVQRADIFVTGTIQGAIEVIYVEERPESFEGPFLREERDLITAIARDLAGYIEQKNLGEFLVQKEDQLRIARDLEQRRTLFINITSHELRTPLTAISGYIDLLEKHHHHLTPQREDHIYKILKKNINRLTQLVEGVSTISELDHKVFSILVREMNLVSCLDTVIETYADTLRDQIEFPSLGDMNPISIQGDDTRLQQVFHIVIDNAIKYTSPDNRKIIISIETSADKIRVQIVDNGTGIHYEDLESIFEEFISIPSEYSAIGSGIGLYIAREIVRGHNGDITAYSKGKGYGATFTVELPLIE